MKATKWLVAAGLAFVSVCGYAQNYWVIETTPRVINKTVIRFYDDQNRLVHDETLTGKTLDVRNRADRKWLDRKLKDFMRQQRTLASKKEAIKSRKG